MPLGGIMLMFRKVMRAEVCSVGPNRSTKKFLPVNVAPAGDTLKQGSNELTVRVANNWVNRMIGDGQLMEDADYVKDQWPTLKEWPECLKKVEPIQPVGSVCRTTDIGWQTIYFCQSAWCDW